MSSLRVVAPSRLSITLEFRVQAVLTPIVSCTFARKIIEGHPTARVWMVEIGSQEHPIPGHHQKNSVKSVTSSTFSAARTESCVSKIPERRRCLWSVSLSQLLSFGVPLSCRV